MFSKSSDKRTQKRSEDVGYSASSLMKDLAFTEDGVGRQLATHLVHLL
jgi:hypothetical protein